MTSPASSAPTRAYFVSSAWLAEHLDDVRERRVLLVETGATAENGLFRSTLPEHVNEGHIPGAVFADLFFQFSNSDSPFGFTAPQSVQFQNAAAQLGITPQTEVIVYDRAQGEWASRFLWLFGAFGHQRVRVLDGGWKKWRSAGGARETGLNTPASQARGTHFAQYDGGWFASTADVQEAIESGGAIRLICGLSEPVYRGDAGNFPRQGHIPTSINLPYTALIGEDNTLKPGFEAPAPVEKTIVYCGAGIVSALLAVKLKEAGQRNVSIYDGSLREWTADARLPLVLGP